MRLMPGSDPGNFVLMLPLSLYTDMRGNRAVTIPCLGFLHAHGNGERDFPNEPVAVSKPRIGSYREPYNHTPAYLPTLPITLTFPIHEVFV